MRYREGDSVVASTRFKGSPNGQRTDILQTKVARWSSIAIRVLSYFFLRMALLPIIPALVFGLFAVYVPAFISGYQNEPKVEVTEEVDVAVTEVVREDDNDIIVKENGDVATAPVPTVRAPADGRLDPVSMPVLGPVDGRTEGEVVGQEVEILETVVSIDKKPLSPLKTLLSGAPNPRSLLLSLASFGINALLVGSVADRLFRERYHTASDLSFVRPGYISDKEAKFLIREPDQSKMPVTLEIKMKHPQPPFDNPTWQQAGGVRWTSNESDNTAVLTIPLPNKRKTYLWRTSNNHSGEFTTPPRVGHAAETEDGPFTFLSTSCIVNRLPYNPLDHPLAIPGMRHLAKVLPSLNPQFMLFLGDFIYADVPRFWGQKSEDYRQKYRQVYASPDWPAVGQNLSWIHVLDDHEIQNDWDANTTGVYETAVKPWSLYNAASNPPPAKKAGVPVAREGATYYEFTQGPASFFLLDTRTHRHSNKLPATTEDKSMLGPEQLEDFLAWLNRPEPKGVKWKIVASSVPFTKNWAVNTQDTWGGFLSERRRILEAMWDAGSRGLGVVVLSGDRHEFAATKFPPPEDGKWPQSAAVNEFSCSPLSQFYSPIPSYRQTDNEDVMIKYINKGNSKFGAITIENLEDGDQGSLKYRLFVDGKEVWNTMIVSSVPAAGDANKLAADGSRIGGGGSDGHLSNYPWKFLEFYQRSDRREPEDIQLVYWGAEAASNPPSADYNDVMNSESHVGVLTNQIKKHGFMFVNNTPYDTPAATEALLQRIAFIRVTHYGGFYDFTPDLAMADTAYTNLALPAHTDTTYFSDPAGLQAFHLLSHTGGAEGGQSLLVDGFRAAVILREEDGRSFDVLKSVRLPWHASGNEGITIAPDKRYPVLEVDEDTNVLKRVRWNNDDRGVVPFGEPFSPEEWYAAASRWDEILRRKDTEVWIQLRPGSVLIFDNWRVLHGRSAFQGVRRICGGYINRDDFISRWRNTNFERKDILDRIIG
ncbi:PhoD-like phosphatase-domain-containing protein [Apodospora peruviana]|uniref:PhoD-like phosphatase-domain-containing protein n=1 Tax=Apodospora peruviana TaxID=516989 RepID=A0AAE0IHK6_9PEZI|nr:PhoD-like phosphatase-domain-containing protein [Apodospora peruviana]